MKVFVCFLASCITVAFCSVKDKSLDHNKSYGSEKEYGNEKKYGYEVKDKSHGYDDDSHKKAYGSEKEYGKEKKYGYESHDKSSSHGDNPHDHSDYSQDQPRDAQHGYGAEHTIQYTFHGKYTGHCGQDGFYYADHDSFVICSNDNAYVQPCAPGSRNSGLHSYNYGDNYSYRDFCDVNLVDHGYGVKGKHGYDDHLTTGGYAKDHYGSYDRYDRENYSRDDSHLSDAGPFYRGWIF